MAVLVFPLSSILLTISAFHRWHGSYGESSRNDYPTVDHPVLMPHVNDTFSVTARNDGVMKADSRLTSDEDLKLLVASHWEQTHLKESLPWQVEPIYLYIGSDVRYGLVEDVLEGLRLHFSSVPVVFIGE